MRTLRAPRATTRFNRFFLILIPLITYQFMLLSTMNRTTEQIPSTISLDASKSQTTIADLNKPLESIVKIHPGTNLNDKWKLVDWSKPISPSEEAMFTCDFTSFHAAKSRRKSQMCVHSFNDVISNTIKRSRSKNWEDCRSLPLLWTDNGKMTDDDSLYVEIGANIGSCVMEMLLSTNANIIAFEPHPMNVYNIKKTISRLQKSYQDRVLLFPIGLGNEESSSIIHSANDNMGNSQIGDAVKDAANQVFSEKLQFPVSIERLDSVLDATKINKIRLVKMDVQGFECKALDGMGLLIKKIEYMKFEYSKRFLDAQGCTHIVQKVRGLGFDVYYDGITVTEDPDPQKVSDFDLLAKNKV